jgi:hypothetical protein
MGGGGVGVGGGRERLVVCIALHPWYGVRSFFFSFWESFYFSW